MFWERFIDICALRNVKPKILLMNCRIRLKTTIPKWKKGEIPNTKVLIRLADELNCSVDYLIGRTDNPDIQKL